MKSCIFGRRQTLIAQFLTLRGLIVQKKEQMMHERTKFKGGWDPTGYYACSSYALLRIYNCSNIDLGF